MGVCVRQGQQKRHQDSIAADEAVGLFKLLRRDFGNSEVSRVATELAGNEIRPLAREVLKRTAGLADRQSMADETKLAGKSTTEEADQDSN